MASTLAHEHVSLRKLVWVGPLAIVAAIIVNLLLRTIAVALFGVPDTFQLLQAPSIISSTIIFLLLAILAFMLVKRFSQRPIRFYRILASVLLLVSFLTPIMALTGMLPAPGMNMQAFWTMIMMHIVSAVIVVGLLTTLTRAQQ